MFRVAERLVVRAGWSEESHENPTCAGTATISYSPGLTYTSQTVTYSTNVIYSPCTSSDPTLTAGADHCPNR